MFASIILLAASFFASFSYILFIKGWASYTSAEVLSHGRIAVFYIWYFVDKIPGTRIWETLTISPLVNAEVPVAGAPLPLFQVSVVLPILGFFKKWLEFRKKRS